MFVVAVLKLVTRVAAVAVEAPGSTRCEMLGQVFPPENFAPCAIAGERFTAARKARVASNRVFISVLRDVGCGFDRPTRVH
jgi:hypothetical protein